MFGRQAKLPVDVILGIPQEGHAANTEELEKQTQEKLRLAFEPARRNLNEHSEKQATNNNKLNPYPSVQTWSENSSIRTLPGFSYGRDRA